MHILYVHSRQNQKPAAPEWSGTQVARAVRRTSRHTANTLPGEAFLENSPEAVELCGAADVIVLAGDLLAEAHTAIQRWKARDKTLIADLDAITHGVSPNGKTRNHKRSAFPTTEELFRWGLRLTHGATSSSHTMVDGWRNVTRTCYLPAFIDLDAYACVGIQPHTGTIIGLVGTFTLPESAQDHRMLEALERLCRRHEEIRFLVIGSSASGGAENDSLHLPARLHERLEPVLPGMSRLQRLAQVDIGLMGGVDCAYNPARDLLELMVMKIPWISVETPDLYDWRRFGWLVEPNPPLWDWILNDMVEKLPAYRKEAGGEPYLFALSRGIDENIEQIVSAYAAIQTQASFGEG